MPGLPGLLLVLVPETKGKTLEQIVKERADSARTNVGMSFCRDHEEVRSLAAFPAPGGGIFFLEAESACRKLLSPH